MLHYNIITTKAPVHSQPAQPGLQQHMKAVWSLDTPAPACNMQFTIPRYLHVDTLQTAKTVLHIVYNTYYCLQSRPVSPDVVCSLVSPLVVMLKQRSGWLGWQSDWLTGWPIDQMTRWPTDQMTRWLDDGKLRRRLTVWYISVSKF